MLTIYEELLSRRGLDKCAMLQGTNIKLHIYLNALRLQDFEFSLPYP